MKRLSDIRPYTEQVGAPYVM